MMRSIFFWVMAMGLSMAQTKDCHDCILWSEQRKLSWSDFKGKPKAGSHNEALTDSGMSIELKCDGTGTKAVIKTFFSPRSSWARSKESAYLLRHEQLHFDITELFTRKLRQQLGRFGNDCEKLNAHINDYYNRNYQELVEYQNRYDRETRHSLNREQQARWEEKVSRELKELSAFGSVEYKH